MKKFIAGLIVGLMFTSTVSFASQGISATFGNFNFLVNGQAKTVATQPIVYNNTSYLPVREISSMLGYDVDYQADTKTIKLTNASQPSPSQSNTNTVKSSTDGYVTLNDLADKYGINTLWGDNEHSFSKGSKPSNKISFNVPSIKDGTYTITTDYGNFTLKMDNSRAFVKADEISNLFKSFN